MCSADSPEAADGPEDAVEIDCGLAVEMPDVGCDLPGGQSPRAGFFLDSQVSVVFAVPFEVVEVAEAVEVEDERELIEDDELVRWALFRGPGMNILPTSSWLMVPMPFGPPLTEFHPVRVGD